MGAPPEGRGGPEALLGKVTRGAEAGASSWQASPPPPPPTHQKRGRGSGETFPFTRKTKFTSWGLWWPRKVPDLKPTLDAADCSLAYKPLTLRPQAVSKERETGGDRWGRWGPHAGAPCLGRVGGASLVNVLPFGGSVPPWLSISSLRLELRFLKEFAVCGLSVHRAGHPPPPRGTVPVTLPRALKWDPAI